MSRPPLVPVTSPAASSSSSSSSTVTSGGSTPKLKHAALPSSLSSSTTSTPTHEGSHSAPALRVLPSSHLAPDSRSSSPDLLGADVIPMTRSTSSPLSTIDPFTDQSMASIIFPTGSRSTSNPGSLASSFVIDNQRVGRSSASRGRTLSSSRGRSTSRDSGGRAPSEAVKDKPKSPLMELAMSLSSLHSSHQDGSPRALSLGAPSIMEMSDVGLEFEWPSSEVEAKHWRKRKEEGETNEKEHMLVPEKDIERKLRKRRRDLGSNQSSETWVKTKEAVFYATSAVLGNAADVAHEMLSTGADLLQFAPVPGLSEAARILLAIWDAVQEVDMNRESCLRLTERCATILVSIREEIAEVDGATLSSGESHPFPANALLSQASLGSEVSSNHSGSPKLGGKNSQMSSRNGLTGLVGQALGAPLERLEAAFTQVYNMMLKQNRRPFLKRYLKRDEMHGEIKQCHAALKDAFDLFSMSIQLRILKQVLHAERKRSEDTAAILESIHHATPPKMSQPLPLLDPSFDPNQAPPSFPIPDTTASPDRTPIGHALKLEPTNLPPPSPVLPSLSAISPVETERIPAPLTALNLSSLNLSSLSQPPTPTRAHNKPSNRNVETTYAQLTTLQNTRDFASDTEDLRRVLQNALQTSDDAEIIRLLQVRKDEMPEAIKALQRALEAEVEKERVEVESVAFGPHTPDGEVAGGHAAGLVRRGTLESSHSRSTVASSHPSSRASRDTLDREFIESSLNSLTRLSRSAGIPHQSLSLPSWTITRYEVDRDARIGVGFFSDVWRGKYNGEVVAVKVLAPWVDRDMFKREVGVWKELRNPHVLELIGASAVDTPPSASFPVASGWEPNVSRTGGPFFFVSRYYERGSVVKWVQGIADTEWNQLLSDATSGVLRMIHEIVKGMAYLHREGIVHGDLKCANILVDNDGHCIISDFGQSELKSEMYRMSGEPRPHGTLRWQAPELLAGQSQLTTAMDVYAFAISCVEILSKGGLPWPLANDETIRHFVLNENKRPGLPHLRPWSERLAEVIHCSWHRNPSDRPSFAQLDLLLLDIRVRFGYGGSQELLERVQEESEDEESHWDNQHNDKSPDMNPVPLPPLAPGMVCKEAYRSSNVSKAGSFIEVVDTNHPIKTTTNQPISSPLPPPQTQHGIRPSRASSLTISSSDGDYTAYWENLASPVPKENIIAELKNERRYRILLIHEYHRSLSLPLWSPSPIALGAVGYHSKPSGAFITLLNAFSPMESSDGLARDMPSLYGYGKVRLGSEPKNKRNAAQRGVDMFQAWLKSKSNSTSEKSVSRRYTSPLRSVQRTAHLYTESTVYRYMADLATPKKWFEANVAQLLELYGEQHAIRRENLILVIGTLDAADYALYVSHQHPDGQVNFDVYTSPQAGQPWGVFSTSEDLRPDESGPVYNEHSPSGKGRRSASKVSEKRSNGPWDTVLLARLRFPTDSKEPTSK